MSDIIDKDMKDKKMKKIKNKDNNDVIKTTAKDNKKKDTSVNEKRIEATTNNTQINKKGDVKNKEQKAEKTTKKQDVNSKREQDTDKQEIEKIEIKDIKKIDEKEIREIGKELKEERRKSLPDDKISEIINNSLWNILVAIIICLYFIFINLGFKNIEKSIFITDLKVFSISILAICIFLFEKSYKKSSKTLAIYGIESLVIAVSTVVLLYICIMRSEIFLIGIFIISSLSIFYYIIKSIINYILVKKKYNKENNELNIILNEEVE